MLNKEKREDNYWNQGELNIGRVNEFVLYMLIAAKIVRCKEIDRVN